ncbi:DUF2190 family protein [Prosthecomicrobium sp. N25]|uniref:DUF2190 family protein n=1 Tax=Prosthecomicrobium sp. N25 TaxID=3129254 RepID=UPI0030787A48
MKNYIQSGTFVAVAAPTGGVSSGDGVLVGSIFGVAATTAAEAADVEIGLTGVYDLPKKSGDTPAVRTKVYWDAANGYVTTTSTSNTLIGAAVRAAAGPDATVRVRLNGTVS